MTSATLFNQNLGSQAQPLAEDGLPPVFKRIVIVGGGTAGWMTAMILARSLAGRGVQIDLLESPAVPIIGVGEGSTPWLRGFFDSMGIAESEWMPACHATYKCGIRFDGWSTKPGFESYFHPFASALDNLTMTQFVHQVHTRLLGADVAAHPDRFFIASELARQQRGPRPAQNFPLDVWYGYHFDATLVGQFLQRKAAQRGVGHHQGHVQQVLRHDNGDIQAVLTKEGQRLEADFFVDCTGFAGLLIRQTLGSPWVSFASNLFNDRAVALPSPLHVDGAGPAIPSHTVSTALGHGWAWRIPLTSRFGNGYVYSSAAISPDQAETELRQHLGLLDADVPARHLQMQIGRVTRHWHHNCLAVGLSQGFIEPLEATALLFIQRTAQAFADLLVAGDVSEPVRQAYNERINAQFEGTRDYIVSHYKTNSRTDTDYWRANAANLKLSDALQELLSVWMRGQRLAVELRRGQIGQGYPAVSWYSLMAGMGIFPDSQDLRPPRADEQPFDLQELDDLLQRSAQNFPDHAALLADIPPQRLNKALTLYLW